MKIRQENYIYSELILVSTFFLSFFQYVVDSRFVIGVAAPILIIVLSGFTIATIRTNSPQFFRNSAILRPRGKRAGYFFAFAVPILPLAMSIYSGLEYSTIYGFLLILTTLAIRSITNNIPLSSIIRAYGVAALLSTMVILPDLVFNNLGSRERFQPFTFHPNLIGLVMVPVPLIAIWFAGGKSIVVRLILYGVGVLLPILIIYQASSRGSLVAVTIAVLVVVTTYDFLRHTRSCIKPLYAIRDPKLILKWVAIVTGVSLFLWQSSGYFFGDSDFTDQLDIFSEYRGLDTGLTGRADAWMTLLNSTGGWTALTGNGFRASDQLLSYEIDNGILVMLYDFGAPLTLIIVGRFVYVLVQSIRITLKSTCILRIQFGVLIVGLILGFVINNITSRHMFGIGNPFSLLGLFFFLAPLRSFQLMINGNEPVGGCLAGNPRATCDSVVQLVGSLATSTKAAAALKLRK